MKNALETNIKYSSSVLTNWVSNNDYKSSMLNKLFLLTVYSSKKNESNYLSYMVKSYSGKDNIMRGIREGKIYNTLLNSYATIKCVFEGYITKKYNMINLNMKMVLLDISKFNGEGPWYVIITVFKKNITSINEYLFNGRRLPYDYIVKIRRRIDLLYINYGFVHWDLHGGNQMIDNHDGSSYIIDFDMSTIYKNATKNDPGSDNYISIMNPDSERNFQHIPLSEIIFLNPFISLVHFICKNKFIIDHTNIIYNIGHNYDIVVLYTSMIRCHDRLKLPLDFDIYLSSKKMIRNMKWEDIYFNLMKKWIYKRLKPGSDRSSVDAKKWHNGVKRHIDMMMISCVFLCINEYSLDYSYVYKRFGKWLHNYRNESY